MGSVSTIYNGVRTWLAGRALMDVAFSDRSTNGVQNKVITAKFDEIESDLTTSKHMNFTPAEGFNMLRGYTKLSGNVAMLCCVVNKTGSSSIDSGSIVGNFNLNDIGITIEEDIFTSVVTNTGLLYDVYIRTNGNVQVFCPTNAITSVSFTFTIVG